MLHSEYITSCFMAKGKKCRMTQHNKEAKQTFHCFVLNSHFIHPSECKYVLFVCLSIRMQVSFILLHFRYFGWRFFFRTVDLSRESRVVPPSLRFSRKRIKIIFPGRCRPRKLNLQKIIPMFSRQNRENLATRKYPIIRYLLYPQFQDQLVSGLCS